LTDLEPKPASAPWRQLLFLFALAAAMAVLIDLSGYRVIFAHPLDDQSWLLYAAGRMLDGTQLYGPKLIETNPPLILWFSALPDFLAKLLHASPLRILQAVVCVLIVFSTAWSLRILRCTGIVRGRFMTCFTVIVILAIESSCTNSSDFGQREHLLVLLLLPYVLAAILREVTAFGAVERIGLGVAAGLAVCFKPQQALIVIGLEVFLVLWHRSARRLWRLESIFLTATVLAYGLLIDLAAPLYLHQIVPLLRDTYLPYGYLTTVHLLGTILPYLACWLAVLCLWLWRHHRLRVPSFCPGLLVCSVCAAAAYCLQHKGFRYQTIPQDAFLLFAAAWLLIESLYPLAIKRFTARKSLIHLTVATLICVLLGLPALIVHGRNNLALWRKPSFPQTVLSRYPPGTPVYIFSMSLIGFHIIFQDHLFWASRYAHLWLLPAIALDEAAEAGAPPAIRPLSPARVQQLAELQRATTVEDFRRWKPRVVLIERCTPTHQCQGLDLPSFDTLAWFLRSPSFSAEWKNYRRQPGDDRYDVYTRLD
jgi:hypothetical protein